MADYKVKLTLEVAGPKGTLTVSYEGKVDGTASAAKLVQRTADAAKASLEDA